MQAKCPRRRSYQFRWQESRSKYAVQLFLHLRLLRLKVNRLRGDRQPVKQTLCLSKKCVRCTTAKATRREARVPWELCLCIPSPWEGRRDLL